MIILPYIGGTIADLNPIINAFKEIGYKNKLIQSDYEYTDFFEYSASTRRIKLGVFGQEPLNYRSACFGVDIRKTDTIDDESLKDLRAFGSPVILIIQNGITLAWHNTGSRLILKDKFKTEHLPNVITANKDIWKPDEMIRAKTGFKKPGPRQIDFIDLGLMPALEKEASTKLDRIIREVLHAVEQEHLHRKIKFDAHKIFQILFRFLTAKLIQDSNIPQSKKIDFSCPEQTLKIVSAYYGSSEKPLLKNIPESILNCISDDIRDIFSFKNISVDTLTYIYENTFVSEKSRKEMGIHSTPPYVAEYVVSQLPIEEIPRKDWNFLDPTCGHGIFLIAAMRRMRQLLPPDWSGKQRHKFFVDKLHGIEIDAFSTEVARMCLMLADFPESNSWDLNHADVFSKKVLEQSVAKSTILIGNPPFEKIIINGTEKPKPAYLLSRALPSLSQASMIGMVLPRSFLDGNDYRDERSLFLKDFEVLSLTSLPDKVFLHSDAETAVVIARKNNKKGITYTNYKEVKDHHKERFRLNSEVSWEDEIPQTYFSDHQQGRLILPLLKELWDYINPLPKLEEYAEIRIGVQYEPEAVKDKLDKVVQEKPFPGSKPGIYHVTEGFMAFDAKNTVYIDISEKLRRRHAWDLDWDRAKVVVPAAPTSRGPWHYAAAIDRNNRIVSRRFYAAWQKDSSISIELIAALLNSPLSQLYVYAHSSKRDIPARVYKTIPVPKNIEKADT
ncbi:MAG: N-6 DNA methylase, partial [Desulfobacteraceae bacterium]